MDLPRNRSATVDSEVGSLAHQNGQGKVPPSYGSFSKPSCMSPPSHKPSPMAAGSLTSLDSSRSSGSNEECRPLLHPQQGDPVSGRGDTHTHTHMHTCTPSHYHTHHHTHICTHNMADMCDSAWEDSPLCGTTKTS